MRILCGKAKRGHKPCVAEQQPMFCFLLTHQWQRCACLEYCESLYTVDLGSLCCTDRL